jgi:hypothetical protein
MAERISVIGRRRTKRTMIREQPRTYLVTGINPLECFNRVKPFVEAARSLGLDTAVVGGTGIVRVENITFHLISTRAHGFEHKVRGSRYDGWIRGPEEIDERAESLIQTRIRDDKRASA